MWGMVHVRSAVVGAFATVAVAGLVFTAVAVSNAQEPTPVADVASVQAAPTTAVSELATARATLASQQATIATLTSRLDAAEWEIFVHGVALNALNGRVGLLEYP